MTSVPEGGDVSSVNPMEKVSVTLGDELYGGRLWDRIDRGDLVRVGVVGLAALAVWGVELAGMPSWVRIVIGGAGLVFGCWPIIAEAAADVRSRKMSMELSMLLAIAAAAIVGEWLSALVIAIFVLVAEILEDMSMDRGRDALTGLMSFLPNTVRVVEGRNQREVALSQVRPGQVIAVSPGGRIPVDGEVLAGRAELDQSRITGESMPVAVSAGSWVYAGSITRGALEIRVERAGEDSSYGQIIAAVRHAQSSEAPVQRLADRLAAWIVYFALAAALATFVLTRDVHSTISVVIVAGACGVAAGTPLAVLASIARAARTGAFVKDGRHMEQLSAVDTVVFDKTGTLTLGSARVVAIECQPGCEPDELIGYAAAAEWNSEHPLGKAIVAQARERGVEVAVPDGVDYTPGVGIRAQVAGRRIDVGSSQAVPQAEQTAADARDDGTAVVHVAVDGGYLGAIHLSDEVRPGAAQCVRELQEMGLRVLLLTGDAPDVASRVAGELGLNDADVRAGLMPADKNAVVRSLRESGANVAMAGDGVNDAPALAVADVGIAMGSGTDIAREAGDIILVSSDPRDLASTMRIARRARGVIIANFVGTLAVDAVGIVLASFGLLGPILAALVHVGSESAFILNSARLVPRR